MLRNCMDCISNLQLRKVHCSVNIEETATLQNIRAFRIKAIDYYGKLLFKFAELK